MRNIKLLLEYDGTDFCGWQVQPSDRTVQGEIEKALYKLTRESIRIHSAGRTDSGVHALGQVVHFKTESHLPVHVFKLGLNPLLPRDVRVLNANEAEDDFHARFSARQRVYQYRISSRPKAVGRQYVWYLNDALNVERMNAAAAFITGTLDFQSFCQTGSDVEHYLCTVVHTGWNVVDDMFVFDITANRFLHNMVRILVGTMVQIGRGDQEPDAMQHILAARDRRKAGPTAPPQGLFLVAVKYETNHGVTDEIFH